MDPDTPVPVPRPVLLPFMGMRSAARIGLALRSARAASGLTQGQAAKRAGISREALSHLENGNRSGRVATLNAVLDVLDYEIAFLPRSDRARRLRDRQAHGHD